MSQLTVTLTPNRSNPRRYASLVVYRREGDRVAPLRLSIVDGRTSYHPLRFRDIATTYEVDAEFDDAWRAHVKEQGS